MPAIATADRFARQLTLPGFGRAGQDRLAAARVVVVGAGGLGSAPLPVLGSAGVGSVLVVAGALVEPTNLPRQTLHGADDVGRPKAVSALDALTPLAGAGTSVAADPRYLDATTVAAMLAGASLVVDATDALE